MNGNNAPAPPSKTDMSNGRGHKSGPPPALPPRGVSIRSRDGSMNRDQVKPPPPAVPPKRSSLTRSDLALFSAENVSIIKQMGLPTFYHEKKEHIGYLGFLCFFFSNGLEMIER